jgi:uncharacterized protein
MEEKVFFDGQFGKICGVLHKVNEGHEIVILVHGFSSTKDRGTLNSTQALAEAGINALRIDLDTRGESELDFETGAGIPNYIKQIESSMEYCKSLGYKEISLIGTSYGGTAAFATALSRPELKKLVLRAPVVDYKEHAIWEYGKDKVAKFKEQGFVPYTSNTTKETFKVTFDFIEKAYPYSMYDNAAKVKIPTLIIQGDVDKEVDYTRAEIAVKFFPNAKLYIVKGAGHNLGVNGDFSEAHKILIDFLK